MTRLILSGIVGLFLSLPASAQFYGGNAGFAPQNTQGVARGLSGAADQGGNLRSFSVSGGNGGFLGGGGNVSNVATPWSTKYGGWVQPANSGMLQDSIARQQAWFQGSMQNQDMEQRRLQLRRATFEEMMFEKMNTPPVEVVREQQRVESLTRARNTPPMNEITSGAALNTLLVNIQRIEAREGVRGYQIPLSEETVNHLNVTTTGDSVGSNEMFRNQEPEWPIALLDDRFATLRKSFNENVSGMVSAQKMGRVDVVKSNNATKNIAAMRELLFTMRFDLSFTNYAQGLEAITKLGNTVTTLSQPGAKGFLNGTLSAQGNTVGELIDHMTKNGLTFAAATTGWERIYVAFYQQLVTYEISMSRLIGDQSTMMFQPTQQKKN